jgi:nucleoside-diphosphate-sugar epimerase
MIGALLAWRGEINWNTIPVRPGEIYYLNSNPAKAERMLGWEPRVRLSDGLERTIEMWRKKLAFVQV